MAEKRSSMKNKREQQRKKAAKARRVRRTLLVITEFLLVCALSICCYAVSILNTMQRSTINQKEIYVATFANNGDNDQQEEAQTATTEPQSKEQEKESEKSGEQESVPESSSAKPGSVINVSEVTQATTVDDILSHQETVNGYWNILLVGVDARDQANLGGGNGVQSDVMMICSINVKTKEVKLVSIYRDTLLKMYSRDEFDLANSEFAKGSDTDMISMINMNLDLQIQDVVVVNWQHLFVLLMRSAAFILISLRKKLKRDILQVTSRRSRRQQVSGSLSWHRQVISFVMVYMQLHIVVTVIRQVWIWEEQAVSVK